MKCARHSKKGNKTSLHGNTIFCCNGTIARTNGRAHFASTLHLQLSAFHLPPPKKKGTKNAVADDDDGCKNFFTNDWVTKCKSTTGPTCNLEDSTCKAYICAGEPDHCEGDEAYQCYVASVKKGLCEDGNDAETKETDQAAYAYFSSGNCSGSLDICTAGTECNERLNADLVKVSESTKNRLESFQDACITCKDATKEECSTNPCSGYNNPDFDALCDFGPVGGDLEETGQDELIDEEESATTTATPADSGSTKAGVGLTVVLAAAVGSAIF